MQYNNDPTAQMKILIVDDHSLFRRLLRNLLEPFPAEVIDCADGSQALGFYERHRPDWVLMDLEMEPVDGFEATAQILSHYPEARILIVTSHESEVFEASARASGACGYMLKDHVRSLPGILRQGGRVNASLPAHSQASRQTSQPCCPPL